MTENGIIKITPADLGVLSGEEYHQGQLDVDIGNLSAWDPAPIDAAAYQGPNREEVCTETARAMAQTLVGQLFQLPGEPVKGGRLAQLPAGKTPLPREKPLPKPKPPTKWEKFAAQKGIQKRKRESKLEWDEGSQSWRRRHGYKKANDESEIPIIEAKPGEQTGAEDPFSKLAESKKQRVATNKKSQLQNAKLADKEGQLPATLKLAQGLGSGSGSNSKAAGPRALPKSKRRELKEEVRFSCVLDSGVVVG
ncbi:ribosome biogenesis regulatory protein-domain-containing protein [Dunaliella salina]|uniref:Ribosome biogenesis regulatory protein n=1 Tax=Dunaliella salina TaxID=3046 RepID=A0ABZ3LPH3_DUNSA|nr:ribosome biogenesis regulatory protein-domain-containing protein [Dunaliella salina]|eukprot:KAF5843321.1 ribosome biogenesis regulatory protein-domain-containing protein [Dunaliella salina]